MIDLEYINNSLQLSRNYTRHLHSMKDVFRNGCYIFSNICSLVNLEREYVYCCVDWEFVSVIEIFYRARDPSKAANSIFVTSNSIYGFWRRI